MKFHLQLQNKHLNKLMKVKLLLIAFFYVTTLGLRAENVKIEKSDSLISLEGVKESYKLTGLNLKNLSEKVLYKKTPQEDLYLYVLRPVNKPTKPVAAIIYFVGGGWVKGSVEYQLMVSAWWRDQGIIAITADYRVQSRHNTSPLECIADAKSAVRYVRSHAAELGVDPNKIIVGGGSAGGHIAACTFLDGGDEKGEDLSVSTKPNALVLHNPVLGEGFRPDFFKEHPEFSPINNVKPGWPPTILSHGTKDTTVPYSGAVNFTKKMKKAGNDVQLITVKDAEHSCDWPVSNPNFLPTLTEMTQFLVRHGFVNPNLVTVLPVAQDSLFPKKDYAPDYVIDWSKNHYKEKISEFRAQPIPANSIVMLGNSLTEGGKKWSEKLKNPSVVNRGISGDVTEGVLNRVGEICFYKPKEIYLLIGINDINGGNKTVEETYPKTINIVKKIHDLSPKTKVYVQSLLPTIHENLVSKIDNMNKNLKSNASKYKYTYIDIHSSFADAKDIMKKELTTDGLHLQPAGYEVWAKVLGEYIPSQK
jgi:acetyl esterase